MSLLSISHVGADYVPTPVMDVPGTPAIGWVPSVFPLDVTITANLPY